MSDVLAINNILSLKLAFKSSFFEKVELRSHLKSAKNLNIHFIQLISTNSFIHAFSLTYFTLAGATNYVQCWNLL